MKNRALIYLLAVLIAFLLMVSCGGCKTDISDDTNIPGEIIITGEVRLLGSALFSNMVITDIQENDWYIENDDRNKLSALEHQEVKVRGKPEYEKITVSGEDIGVKRYLRDIKILK